MGVLSVQRPLKFNDKGIITGANHCPNIHFDDRTNSRRDTRNHHF